VDLALLIVSRRGETVETTVGLHCVGGGLGLNRPDDPVDAADARLLGKDRTLQHQNNLRVERAVIEDR